MRRGDRAAGPAGPAALARREVVIIAAAETGVEADGLRLHRAQRDLFRRGGGAAPQHDHALGAIGKHDRPLQGPHPAHRPPDHGRPFDNSERVGERGLDGHLVASCDHGEARSPWPAVGRV